MLEGHDSRAVNASFYYCVGRWFEPLLISLIVVMNLLISLYNEWMTTPLR